MTNKLTEAFNKLQRDGLNARLEERNETLLIWASSEGYTEIALALIKAKVNLDEQNSDGNTALIRCACEGRKAISDALIKAKANLNIQNNEGYTAAILAKRRQNFEIADDLIDAGADISLTTQDGQSVENAGYSPKTSIQGPRDADLERQIIEKIRDLSPD